MLIISIFILPLSERLVEKVKLVLNWTFKLLLNRGGSITVCDPPDEANFILRLLKFVSQLGPHDIYLLRRIVAVGQSWFAGELIIILLIYSL